MYLWVKFQDVDDWSRFERIPREADWRLDCPLPGQIRFIGRHIHMITGDLHREIRRVTIPCGRCLTCRRRYRNRLVWGAFAEITATIDSGWKHPANHPESLPAWMITVTIDYSKCRASPDSHDYREERDRFARRHRSLITWRLRKARTGLRILWIEERHTNGDLHFHAIAVETYKHALPQWRVIEPLAYIRPRRGHSFRQQQPGESNSDYGRDRIAHNKQMVADGHTGYVGHCQAARIKGEGGIRYVTLYVTKQQPDGTWPKARAAIYWGHRTRDKRDEACAYYRAAYAAQGEDTPTPSTATPGNAVPPAGDSHRAEHLPSREKAVEGRFNHRPPAPPIGLAWLRRDPVFGTPTPAGHPTTGPPGPDPTRPEQPARVTTTSWFNQWRPILARHQTESAHGKRVSR